ncbi:MAG: hypothetical protein ABSG89_12365 [Bacteroidales bacterium]
MKKPAFLFVLLILMAASCSPDYVKSRLIQYDINNLYYSPDGYACRFSVYKADSLRGYGWKIYDLLSDSLNIRAYDTTFVKNIYEYPSVTAVFNVKPDSGTIRRYVSSAGQMRLLGYQDLDILGDFYFTMKNKDNPLDSFMLQSGYFRIFLDYRDSIIAK